MDINQRGLKDHEISSLVNDITAKLYKRFQDMPECLREIVKSAVLDNLESNNLRIDSCNANAAEKQETVKP